MTNEVPQGGLAKFHRPRLAQGVKLHRHMVEEMVSALRAIFVEKRHADRVIQLTLKKHRKWGARDRGFFAESLYDMVRWWRWLWWLADLSEEEFDDAEAITDDHLWLVWAAYQRWHGRNVLPLPGLKFMSQQDVEDRSREQVPIAVRASIPDWLEERCVSELGDEWRSIRGALNDAAPVFLRANCLKTDRDTLRTNLVHEGVETATVADAPDALRLEKRQNVFGTDAFKRGLFEVQDAGSQRIVPFLKIEPGQRVVDACAGGGGKTLHAASLMGNKGKIIAMDIHQWKLDELRKRAKRAGVDVVETRLAEGAKSFKRFSGKMDRVLLDVPCSGLGVLRRNPDAKWKLSNEEIDRLIDVQKQILESASRMVNPGGYLVYATCSILPSENEKQVQAFLETRSSEWKLEEEMHLHPQQDAGDGFYAARLLRVGSGADAAVE